MRVSAITLAVAIASSTVSSAALPSKRTSDSMLENLDNLSACTTPSIRREWGDFSLSERAQYIAATKCMEKLPSKIPPGIVPAATSRYHDFIATHINQTLHVHGDGIFLQWHRHFTWLWETALRTECGYKGTQPYWNWTLWANDLKSSPLFDNSPTSFSGDGIYEADAEVPTFAAGTLPRGSGGGCVIHGPFANRTLPFRNFGQLEVQQSNGTLAADALDYQPHCFRRDLNTYIATHFTNRTSVISLLNAPNISALQSVYDGVPGSLNLGPHPGGHYTAGPDLFDFYASPSDPVFYLHHGMIDLTYTAWQAEDPRTRQYALSGGSTTFDIPPSANVTIDFKLDFGYLAPKIRLGDVMDVKKGPYCYQYKD